MNRERRQWTPQEDELLRMAVSREEPGNPAPSKWHAIAQHVPNRTNKDCRKRWYAKMSSDVVKGGWAPDEDQRLLNAIDSYGTRWSLVASMVQTRNSDQCAKRWCDTLNPAIDRTAWSAEADEILIKAVNEHGKVWTKIVQNYFPGRTGLAAKNRYNSITRSEDSTRSSSRRRHSPDSSPSPPLEIDPYYGNARSNAYSGSSSMTQPGFSSTMQHGGHHGRHHSMSQSTSQSSAFPAPSRRMSQFQPPVAPNYPLPNQPLTQPSAYYSTGSSSRYPAAQFPAQPSASFPSDPAAFPDYSSSLSQGSYGQPQQMQYPNTAYTAGYSAPPTYPGTVNQSSSSGLPRTTSDPRNWSSF
ncbi:hypothetical protein C8R46DRAFT_1228115 [Mycena filopes]|nr:hypothetical protein C8R46DRAFT_1228115 [Mycena filopes]